MNSLGEKQIVSRNFDLIFIKFPIIFPIIYGLFLFSFPQYENILIFVTLLFLAEAHFGATWPFFLSKYNTNEIKKNKFQYVIGPIFVVIFCLFGFFLCKKYFSINFFCAKHFPCN